MSVSHAWELSSDAELITAVRSGDSAAFGVLYERHAVAARTVARQYSNSVADAEDSVSDAFARVFSAIQGGGGPDVAFRAYLFTVVRRVAMTRVESGRRAVATDDMETFESAFGEGESTEEPTMAGFERGVVSQAYRSLPERWQAVLWYTEVEELTPAEIAPILGLTSNGVAALAYRAREGLRQAYLQQHLAAPTSEACTLVNSKLGAYVRGGLAKRETALVESHLEECGTCRALVLELGDVNHGMRLVIGPLVLGAAAMAALKGIGFGGMAGAVGAGAGGAAGSAGGGAAGGGSAAGGGGTGTAVGGGGTGTGVGGGAAGAGGAGGTGGAAGGVGVGAGAGGAGAGVGAGAGAGAVGATGAGSLVGVGSLVGAGAGVAGAGATAAGAAVAAGGGLAAIFGGIPMVVVGVATAGVLTAGGLGVAGMMGAFSGPDVDDAAPVAAPTDGGQSGLAGDASGQPAAPSAGGGGAQSPAIDETDEPEPDDAVADPALSDPTIPTNIPPATGSGTPVVDVVAPDGTGTSGEEGSGSPAPGGPTATPTPTPGTGSDSGEEDGESGDDGEAPVDPVDPGDEGEAPVDPGDDGKDPGDDEGEAPGDDEPPVRLPANLVVADVGDLSFVAGIPTMFSLTLSNDGEESTGVVHAELSFEPGVEPTVEVVSEPLAGVGAARAVAVTTGWTCEPAADDPSRVLCTLPDLPGATTSTLTVRVVLQVDGLRDASREVGVGLATWAPGLSADRPEPAWVKASVASAPADYELVLQPGFDPLSGVRRGTHGATVRVANTGGTTGSGLGLQVALPDGFQLARGGDWAECEQGYCLSDLRVAPGDENAVEVPLNIVVGPAVGAGDHEVGVALTDGAGEVREVAALTVPVAAPTISPVGSISVGSCWFDAGEETSYRTVTVTLDNTGSDVPVAFTVAATGQDGQVLEVAAGATSTATITLAGTGATVQVSAGDWSQSLVVPAFDCTPPPTCPSEWEPLTLYSAGALVSYDGSIYRSEGRPDGVVDFILWLLTAPYDDHPLWTLVGPCDPAVN